MEAFMNHKIADSKEILRKEMLLKRKALSIKDITETSVSIIPPLMDFIDRTVDGKPGKPLTVMSYMSHKNEFPTIELNQMILDRGWRLLLPYTDRNFEITACIVCSLDGLRPSPMGILEPDPSAADQFRASDADLILLPGIAFDLQGRRLGYGKGCYDRFLSSGPPLPVTAALTWSFQIIDRVPSDPHDIPCDYLITEKQIIKTAR